MCCYCDVFNFYVCASWPVKVVFLCVDGLGYVYVYDGYIIVFEERLCSLYVCIVV